MTFLEIIKHPPPTLRRLSPALRMSATWHVNEEARLCLVFEKRLLTFTAKV
ncbi:MAG: hypothetical protein JWR87_1996, partial [Segetibacter sp.]|nr:hypothetical protein [Segetibacter sp.]